MVPANGPSALAPGEGRREHPTGGEGESGRPGEGETGGTSAVSGQLSGILTIEVVTEPISPGRPACDVGQNLSRTPPLHGLRTAGPSMGRTPLGQNPADSVGKMPCYRGNEPG